MEQEGDTHFFKGAFINDVTKVGVALFVTTV